MTHSEQIEYFFKKYKENYLSFCEWNDRLYQNLGKDEWIAGLVQRAFTLSGIYSENAKLIHDILDPLEKLSSDQSNITGLNKEDFECLFQWTKDMYLNEYDDPFILKRLGKMLLKHYEAFPNLERLPFVYLILGYANVEISRIGDAQAKKDSVYYYQKLTELREHFSEFKEECNRTYIVVAYYNLIITNLSVDNIDWQTSYILYMQFMQFYSKPEVKEAAKTNERVKVLGERIKVEYPGVILVYVKENNKGNWDEVVQDPAFPYVEEMNEAFYKDMMSQEPDYPDYSVTQVYSRLEELRDRGLLSNDIVWELENELYLNKKDCEDVCETDPIGVLVNPLTHLFYSLSNTSFSKAEREMYAVRYRKNLLEFLKTYPTGVNSYSLNTALREIGERPETLVGIPTASEKEEFIAELMVTRHLSTYIHSLMVGKLAMAIAEYTMEHKPELMLGIEVQGIGKLKEIQDVSRSKEAILDFLKRAALLHDIGKNGIVDIISTEYRPIQDEEFRMIRMHPRIGAGILSMESDFERYHDIAYGHHKFYNGKGGYPAEFDNTKSPMRFLIDIISISDTLDAATDRLGRNYHSAKNFQTVLKELVSRSDVQYNPKIVQMLSADSKFQKRMCDILEKERDEVYYEVYHKYFKK